MRRRWLLVVAGGLALLVLVALFLTRGEAPSGTVTAPASGTAATLAISPVRSVLTQGRTDRTLTYTVGNSGDSPRYYAISTSELTAKGQVLPAGAASAARWAQPLRTRVKVPAHDSAQVKVRVRVPSDRGAQERRIGITFADSPTPGRSTVGVRARITTSVYVEGTGPVTRGARLSDLRLPHVSDRTPTVSALLSNSGTVNLVPGAEGAEVVGTLSRGSTFSLGGALAPPRGTTTVTGRAALPWACWCQVRVSTPDQNGGRTQVVGRVLVLPWTLLGVLLGLAVAALGAVLVRRRLRDRAPLAPVAPAAPPTGPRTAPAALVAAAAPEPTTVVVPVGSTPAAAATTGAAAKKAPARKTAAKKVPAKKVPATSGTATRKAVATKAAATKTTAKKTTAKRAAAGTTTPATKAASDKPAVKRAPATRSRAAGPATKKATTAKRTPAPRTPTARSTTPVAHRTAGPVTTSVKAPVPEAAAKKAAPRKVAAKKTAPRKAAAKKTAPAPDDVRPG